MKRLFMGVMLILSISVSAQQNADLPLTLEDSRLSALLVNRRPAQLHIKLINAKRSAEGTVVKYTTVQTGPRLQRQHFASLDREGEVTIVLHDNLPYQQVWLSVGELFYTGLIVNNDLDLTIDAARIVERANISHEGVYLRGEDAALNLQLGKRRLHKSNERSDIISRFTSLSISSANGEMPFENFLKQADSVYAASSDLDSEFLQTNPGFAWAIENERNSDFFEWFIVGCYRSGIPERWVEKIEKHRPYFVTNEGAGFYRSLCRYVSMKTQERAKMLISELYKQRSSLTQEQKAVLDSIVVLESGDKSANEEELRKLYARRTKLFSTQIDRIYLQQSLLAIDQSVQGPRADMLKLWLMEGWKDKYAYAYPVLSSSIQTKWMNNIVETELAYEQLNQRKVDELFKTATVINPSNTAYLGRPIGELEFGASLYTLDSIQKIEDFVFNLRARFPGKALILDIWATWCAPCISDIPNSIDLHQKNADLPIEYIYLCSSSGSDEATWKRRIGSLKPPGHHIFIDDRLLNLLRKVLNAEGGFPTYVVIDREGGVKPKAIQFMGALNRNTLKDAVGIQ